MEQQVVHPISGMLSLLSETDLVSYSQSSLKDKVILNDFLIQTWGNNSPVQVIL